MERILTIKELQDIELQIMISFDDYCRNNGLEYSLGGGSMIGAIRHNGFIPWDDDIDVFMLRREYNKLLSMTEKDANCFGEKYILLSQKERGYYYPYIKLVDKNTKIIEKNLKQIDRLGVWIDIFPIDYISDDKEKAIENTNKNVKVVKKIMKLNTHRNYGGMKSRIINGLYDGYRLLNFGSCEKLIKYVQRFSENEYKKYGGTVCWALSEKDCYPMEYFDSYMDVLFEGYKFKIFSKYDEILSSRYGNYKELPLIENRVSHSPFAFLAE